MSSIISKVVLITGCNGGIGKTLCREFMAAGYLVIGTDLHTKDSAKCDRYIACDLSVLASSSSTQTQFRDDVTNFVREQSAELKVIINNAAAQITGSLKALSISDFQFCQQVNVVAPFVMAKLFEVPLRQANGAFLNIGSIHSRLTKPGFSAYSTSKAALSGLTRALALEFAGDVTVNTVSPAATKTEMLLDGFRGQQEKYNELGAYHPVGRIAETEEIVRLVQFLCSENARFITGADLPIDGGIGGRLHDPI